MSKAEQVALGTTLAGVNQYKVFSAVMTNFKTAVKATDDALNSEGSAIKENAKYMESIQAKIQTLKAEIQKLVFEQNLLQNSFKAILDVLIKVVQFFTSVQGKIVLFTTAIALAANVVATKLSPALKSIPYALFQAYMSLSNFTSGVWTATEALDAFTTSMNIASISPFTIAITAVIAIVTALSVVLYKAAKYTEEHTKKLKEQKDIIDEAKSNIESYQEELLKINQQIDEINNKGLDVDKNSEENLRKLRLEREELEKLVQLEELREERARQKARKEAEKVFKSKGNLNNIFAFGEKAKESDMTILGGSGYDENDAYERLVSGGYLTKELADSFLGITPNLSQQLQIATANMKYYGDEFTRLSKLKEEAQKKGLWNEEDEKQLNTATENLQLATNAALSLDETLEKTIDSSDSSAQGWIQAKNASNQFHDALGQASEETKNYIGLSGDLDEELEEEQDSIEEVADAWKYNEEEKLQAQETLSNLKLKEKELQQQIGMSSLELVRQANEWHTSSEALFHYLKNLNDLNESIDNVQSSYKTLKSAVDEYNESGGFSVDTLQELLALSPEYLQTLFDENGELRLQNGVLELNEQSIKNKVSAMAAEAKQNIYNTAIERISNLSKDENTKKAIKNQEAYDNSTEALKRHEEALVKDAKAEYLNTIAKSRTVGGVKDTYINQIIKETEEQIALVDKMMESLGTDFSKAMDSGTKSTKDTNNALKEQNQLLKQQKQLLEEKKKQYESVVAYIKKKIQDEIKSIEAEKKAQVDSIKEQINALKDLKEEETDRIQEQIDALKEQKDVEQEYWQKKIDALKEQNDELKDQLEYEELLEDLAKAKSKRVRVYKDGKFVYTEDSSEVDKAQAKIEEYERKKSYEEQLKVLENYKKQSENNYDEQIKALEKLKDEKEKNYEQQIKDLEKYQEQVEADYDARIKYFQDYLDKFTKETDAYENETNRQLAIQLTGIDFEQQGWQTRLDNLSDFVEKYNALLGDIHTLDSIPDSEEVEKKVKKEEENNKETISKEVAQKLEENKKKKINNINLAEQIRAKTMDNASKATGNLAKTISSISSVPSSVPSKVVIAKHKASGDSYIKDDGTYLVGDSPNQELVIGSKINGNLMNLTQGSGVVNATSTRTLAGMLNQLGLIGNQGVNMSNSQNKSTSINIGNISLPSVQNGKDFVDYLQNFSLQMTQESFA